MKNDVVYHPSHYTQGKIDCIDAMTEAFGVDEVMIFCKLNAFKYLWRAEKKGGVTDIAKANWYLDKYLLLNAKEVKNENNSI